MELLLAEIEHAVARRYWLLALHGALVVPDICGALGASDGRATGARFAEWFDQNMGPEYAAPVKLATGEVIPFLDGDAAYIFRCGLLHQGTTVHPKSPHARIVFAVSSNVRFHLVKMNNVLALDIPAFCGDTTKAARRWLQSNVQNSIVQGNLTRSIRFHPNGSGGISGVPVIG